MGITSASEFRQRKAVTLPSGRTVEIRKLQPTDFQAEAPRLFDLSGHSQDQIQEKLVQDPKLLELAIKALEKIFVIGVVTPKVSAMPVDQLEDDEVHISDIGDDSPALLQAILKFSGVEGVVISG